MFQAKDIRLKDGLAAAGVFCAALGVYVVTMYPGIGDGDGDSAKFAFLARVLGTAHPPGYPSYVLIAHLFSYLPVGTLAYRINLMSAVFAALGSVAVFVGIRALAVRRSVAAAMAAGMAFGSVYWSKAALAEVYSLNACLIAATVACLLWWERQRRPGLLLAAVALASLAFGNHLTSAAMVPAYVVFALAVDRRTCLKPGMLAAVAGLVAVGVAQYGFIILRTVQGAPYLEAQARSLGELWNVVTARRYADAMFQFSWHDLLMGRVPDTARLMYGDMGSVGVLALGLGVAVLCGARWRQAVLLVGGAAGLLTLSLNVDADAIGFFSPVVVVLWPVAAIGAEWLLSRIERTRPAYAVALAGVVLAGLPAAQIYANFTSHDHRRATAKTAYFAALINSVPSRAAIVKEDYPTDMAVLYKLLGERAQGERDVRLSPADPVALRGLADEGFEIFAFRGGVDVLGRFGYRFSPHRLIGGTLDAYLRGLKPGWIVAMAGTPGVLRTMPATVLRGFGAIGASLEAPGPVHGAFGIVGVRGASTGARIIRGTEAVDIVSPAGSAVGGTAVSCRVPFRVSGDGSGASISVNGQTIAAVSTGIVVAVFREDGIVIDAEHMEPELKGQVPIDAVIRPVSRATFAARCDRIGNLGWREISADAETGRLALRVDNSRPFDSHFSVYLAGALPFAPAVGLASGSGRPQLTLERFDTRVDEQRRELTLRATLDRLAPDVFASRGPHVSRVEIVINDGGNFAVLELDAGALPAFALAKASVDRNDPTRATACSAPGREDR